MRSFSSSTLLVPLAAVLALAAIGWTAPPDSRQALVNSAILAAGAIAIALPPGLLLSILIARYDLPGRRLAAACLGMLLFLPLYVQLSGWDAFLGKLGWLTLSHGSVSQPFLAGMRGAIFVHGMAAVPWVALIVGIGLLQIDAAQEEAALLVAAPRAVLWRITLPKLRPLLVAAALWTCISTISEMTVTNIYLVDPRHWTYTERFYMTMALSAEAGKAALAVLPGALALCVVVALLLSMASRLIRRRVLTFSERVVTFPAGPWRPVLTAALWLIVALLLGVPVISLLAKAGFVVVHVDHERVASWSLLACLSEISRVPWRFGSEIRGTIEVATGAATLALLVATAMAWWARRGGRASIAAIVLVTLTLAIPGPLVGTALIGLFNHDLPPKLPWDPGEPKSWLLVLYDNTILTPLLAQAIRALPLAILLMWQSFSTLNDDVLAAAALDGLSPLRVCWRVAVPQRWRAIAAAWIAAFAVAAGDVAWAQLVRPPGLDLLQRRVFGLVHSGVEEQVAAISLVTIMAYAALALLATRLMKAQRGISMR